jgi:hypothetical protein
LIETADDRRIAGASNPNISSPNVAMPKLPDAILAVTAVRTGCTRMLSFDRALKLPEGLRRVTLDGLPLLIEEL